MPLQLTLRSFITCLKNGLFIILGFPVVLPLSPLICFRETKCTIHKQLEQKLLAFLFHIFT